MCGLAGLIGPGASRPELLDAMGASLAHRGPDAHSVWSEPSSSVALVHRRLSILELSEAGTQPMVSANGRWVLAFNGEIYNHQDLRADLDRVEARPWRGRSDTEVLVEAIANWGIERTLSRSNGMFAFAAWDRCRKELTLARDRFGEKPLYVGPVGADILFASELKAFRVHPSWRHSVEPKALSWLFQFGYVPAPWSIHEGVFKLAAGSFLKLAPADAGWRPDVFEFEDRLHRWWRLDEAVIRCRAKPWTHGREDALQSLQEILDDAVRLRMVSDVQVGALLSGGIDSALVVASMARQSSRAVQTFTVGFEERSIDESDDALETARYLGTDHTQIFCPSDAALAVVDRLPNIYDEPFADAAQIPAFLVSQAAAGRVKVALTGDGGDEIFGGYQRYLDGQFVWRMVGMLPSRVRVAMARGLEVLSRPMPASDIRARMLRQSWRLGAKDIDDYAMALLRFPGATPAFRVGDPAWPTRPDKLRFSDPGEQFRYLDQALTLPEGIHTKLDRASMAVSLELRVPLIDQRLLELAWRVPSSWHVAGGMGKRMLRRLVQRRTPPPTADRRKHGFDVPVAHWLREPLRDWAESLLSAEALQRDPHLDAGHIRCMWERHVGRFADHGYALWAVLMYRAWSERYG